jgi:hypothetical protein
MTPVFWGRWVQSNTTAFELSRHFFSLEPGQLRVDVAVHPQELQEYSPPHWHHLKELIWTIAKYEEYQ